MEPNQDAPEVLETPETEVEQQNDVEEVEEGLTPEEIEELRTKAAKADELEVKNRQLFERAKSAEAKAKEPAASQNLSTKDVLYLSKADIAADDVDEVLTYAQKMGVSVKEAHDHYKPILDVRAEQRRSAQATSTRSPRGSQKIDGEQLLRKAEATGQVPETDEGLAALFAARQAERFKKRS